MLFDPDLTLTELCELLPENHSMALRREGLRGWRCDIFESTVRKVSHVNSGSLQKAVRGAIKHLLDLRELH